MLPVLYSVLCVMFHLSSGSPEPDPCLPLNYVNLSTDGGRSSKCSKIAARCDHYLDSGWYRTPDATITTKCPPFLGCGFTYPVWMNACPKIISGTLPTEAEGIGNRTGCTVTGPNPDECCLANTTNTIRVKNCTTYLVYFLEKRIGCDEGYCFDSSLPCPTTSSTSSSTQTSALSTEIFSTLPRKSGDDTTTSPLPKDQILAIAIGIAVFMAFVTVGVFGIIYIKSRPRDVKPERNVEIIISVPEKMTMNK